MNRLIAVGLLSVFAVGCATAARFTLQDRFQAIGIPTSIANCMVTEIDQQLSDEDLQDLARYTLSLSRSDSTLGAVRSLMRIDNPRAVSAVGRSAVSCVSGFRP